MNKSIFKILICFTLSSAVIAVILLFLNFIGIAWLQSDENNLYPGNRRYVLEQVSAHLSSDGGIVLTDESVVPEGHWCMLIDENGDVIWDYQKPEDVPVHYSLNDIARMARWYLEDYPVYLQTETNGLLVLGAPKNSVGKYPLEYSMAWFDTLPQRIFFIFGVNLILAVLLVCLFGGRLYQKLNALTEGICDLKREQPVNLKEKGIFKELSRNINDASAAMERKNAALLARDSARSNWIAGISHDLRTPLSLILGYSESLADTEELPAECRKKVELITMQSVKMKHLIEDLNLISSLEYDMQPSRKQEVRLCPLLRQVASDLLNNGLSADYSLHIDVRGETAVVMGDSSLLERAFFNLLYNSVKYNPQGCAIEICQYIEGNTVFIQISDNGGGVPEEVLEHITEIPKTAHGLGLPMTYKIIGVHGGQMKAVNDHGFSVLISLPLA